MQAVYVQADDLIDPSATTFSHLDSTTVLARTVAAFCIYLAVYLLASSSRTLNPEVLINLHFDTAEKVKNNLQRYSIL